MLGEPTVLGALVPELPSFTVASSHDEVALAAFDELDFGAGVCRFNRSGQTDRLGPVASHHTVFDAQLHARTMSRACTLVQPLTPLGRLLEDVGVSLGRDGDRLRVAAPHRYDEWSAADGFEDDLVSAAQPVTR